MNPLEKLLKNSASLNRLNTIENAYGGGLGTQKNFKVKWTGFDSSGQATVRYKGNTYKVNNSKAYGLPASRTAVLRVGKGTLNVT